MLAKRWMEKVIGVDRVSHGIILIKLAVSKTMLSVVCVYALQCGLSDTAKEQFYDSLISVVSKLSEKEMVVVAGNLNGHVGQYAEGYEGVHGGFGFGDRNAEGVRVLDFGDAMGMSVVDTAFKKKYCRRKTYQSGDTCNQID